MTCLLFYDDSKAYHIPGIVLGIEDVVVSKTVPVRATF